MGRTKNLKRSRRDYDEDNDVSSDQGVKSSSKANKKAKTPNNADSGRDDEGNSFWSLGGTRRATVSTFKGKTYINIREYYSDASGTFKPGKKGIMLSPEQYNKLLEAIPFINSELRGKGHETPDVASAPAPKSPEKAKSKKTKKTKSNIEATSDEEDDEDDKKEKQQASSSEEDEEEED
ncbi:PC4-domain-containing protein [Hypoxylon fragiforme]|uniref:PC4-domain-containing protein n=1 Tax=Hypoxylon fragiforme TaxID=63214 RepID=UPI0020C5B8EF|nr:PC4-domain-containing protein [Hypoxylon fragiforme]KAI2606036.1 PC4-domain-containing protein [Hypoxylon fragiforme]